MLCIRLLQITAITWSLHLQKWSLCDPFSLLHSVQYELKILLICNNFCNFFFQWDKCLRKFKAYLFFCASFTLHIYEGKFWLCLLRSFTIAKCPITCAMWTERYAVTHSRISPQKLIKYLSSISRIKGPMLIGL